MIPTSSSSSTNGCDSISSNCVIWQGPDIACINLCNGDTISEVVSKLATEVCTLITDGVVANPSLAGLDLSCLDIQGITPTTLVPVLQAMVVQICANSGAGAGGPISTPGFSNLSKIAQTTDTLPIMTLPACLQYNDINGNPVTQLRLDLFASLIANQVCTNLASINVINTTLTSYNSRIGILEACVLPCSGAVVEAQIVPTCVSNVGVLTDVSVVVLALENAFCALRTAVGMPAAINSAISQSIITGSYTQLSNSSASYSGIVGWNNSPSTLAQSMQNAWVVIDDMYTAITSIQTNCCPSGCDSITFAYTTSNTINAGSGLITSVVFNFTGSSIPSTFNDSSGFSQVTITDVDNVITNQIVNVSSLQNDASGISVDVSALNTLQQLNVALQFSVTDNSDTCTANQSSVIPGIIPCPSVTLSSIISTGVTISFPNTLGTSAVYTIDILDSSSVVVSTISLTNQSSTVNTIITSLIPGSTYNVRVTVGAGGGTKVCPLTPFNTVTQNKACSLGMDVAFIIDYTGSMGSAIDAIKTGATSLVNTISSSSGVNDYRISLVTADEYASNASPIPTYLTSTEYVALPGSQRIINTGTADKQVITAWEMFQTNNGASFTTQLQKLNTGAPTAGVPLGSGSGAPEPTDMALGQVIEASAFTGAFRSNVAKYVIIITDALPGGDDDVFDNTDVARLNSLQTTALLNGIKIFVCGPGTSATYVNGLTTTYPWRDLSINTGGNWNVDEDPSTISAEIVAGCS